MAADLKFECVSCGAHFWWTVNDQVRDGYVRPKRCPGCRAVSIYAAPSTVVRDPVMVTAPAAPSAAASWIAIGIITGLLIALLLQIGMLHRWNGGTADTNTPVYGQARGLRAEHRCLLQQAGWLEFVLGSIDAVEYFPWPGFEHSSGPVVGLGIYEDGLREALVTTQGQDDIEILSTIVHQAAQFADLAATQDEAERIRQQFIQDIRNSGGQTCEGVRHGR